MKKNNYFGLLVFLSLLIIPSAFPQENITVTTYYPAPVGVYENLRFFPTTAAPACNANNEGIAYYDNTTNLLMICRQTQTAPNTYGFQSAGSLWVQAGTTGPNGIDPRAIQPFDTNLKVGIGDVNMGWNRQNRLAITDNTSTNGLGEQIALMEILNPRRGNSGTWSGGGDSVTALLLSPGAAAWQVRADEFSPTDGAFMIHEADIPAPRLVIRKGTGNVGIGTTNPTTNLEIASGVPLIGNMGFGVGNQNWRDMWYDGGTNGHFAIANTSPLNTGGTEFIRNVNGVLTRGLLYIGNDGNVGIGTAQPGSKLHVYGTDPGHYAPEAFFMSGDPNGLNLLIGMNNIQTRTGTAFSTLALNAYGGSVSVGVTNAGTYKLYVNGSIYATNISSDSRLKKNVEELNGMLEKIKNIRGVTYEWQTDKFPQKNLPAGKQIGIIAQEVEKEFPELVGEDNQGYKTLAYDHFTAVLLEAVKEQQREIDVLQKEIKELKNENK